MDISLLRHTKFIKTCPSTSQNTNKHPVFINNLKPTLQLLGNIIECYHKDQENF